MTVTGLASHQMRRQPNYGKNPMFDDATYRSAQKILQDKEAAGHIRDPQLCRQLLTAWIKDDSQLNIGRLEYFAKPTGDLKKIQKVFCAALTETAKLFHARHKNASPNKRRTLPAKTKLPGERRPWFREAYMHYMRSKR
jgi:hypothetical protein